MKRTYWCVQEEVVVISERASVSGVGGDWEGILLRLLVRIMPL